MRNSKKVMLKNKHTLLDDIQRFSLANKSILLITSTPSISTTIKHKYNIKNVFEITGANNNEFNFIVDQLKRKNVTVLIMGIEQLLNQVKRDIIIEYFNYADVVLVDNIHHISKTNFDYRPEYENIQFMHHKFITSDWFLYAYTLSKEDIYVLKHKFSDLSNCFLEQKITYSYYSQVDEKRLSTILSLAKNHSIVCITHDYLFAEMFANQCNRFIPCKAIHRKVEESNKVATTIAWQTSSLSSIVITSDTNLPYPYPGVDYVVWLDMPLSYQQISFYQQLFFANDSMLVFNKETYTPENVFVHQFPYSNLLNDVVQSIIDNPSGLTMREIERIVDGESYVLEKAMKGLRAFNALKKKKLAYVMNQPFTLTSTMIQDHETVKNADFKSLYISLQHTDSKSIEIDPRITDTVYHYPLAVRPKVLFPIGFFNSSLIKKEHQSKTGYVFYKGYSNLNKRIQAIKALLDDLSLSSDDISITCLCEKNDAVEQLMAAYAKTFHVSSTRVFDVFQSKLLKEYFNPYHKMKCIMSQFKLVERPNLNDVIIVFADHGDQFWQMGVVAKALLEEKLTKEVIVVFNQP